MSQEFGDFIQYEQARKEMDTLFLRCASLSGDCEHQKFFIMAAIRRTNSLAVTMKQSVEVRNGQMCSTLLRLHLDTLARFYILYWADEDPLLTAEGVSRAVFHDTAIRKIKFTNQDGKAVQATDRNLIDWIAPLAPWIGEVYKIANGAVHFSSFHIHQVLDQAENRSVDDAGALHLDAISMSPFDTLEDPQRFREVKQAFLHITLMLIEAIRHRCEILETSDNLDPANNSN